MSNFILPEDVSIEDASPLATELLSNVTYLRMRQELSRLPNYESWGHEVPQDNEYLIQWILNNI